jgi:uncharacterized protein Usg
MHKSHKTSVAEPEPHHIGEAEAPSRCGSGSDGSGSKPDAIHGKVLKKCNKFYGLTKIKVTRLYKQSKYVSFVSFYIFNDYYIWNNFCQIPDNLLVLSDNMDNIIFDIDDWPELVVQTYDLAGSEMEDYSVFPVPNRTADINSVLFL